MSSAARVQPPLAKRQESRTLNIKTSSAEEQNATGRWPRSCINHKIEELDGVFFDSFQNVIHQQDSYSDETSASAVNDLKQDQPLPSDSQLKLKKGDNDLTSLQVELLCIEALYTIKHKIGRTSESHLSENVDLYAYVEKAFGISQEDQKRLVAKANEEKPPIVVLDISVVEARHLEAKDADGFSDPYCMLGIIPASEKPDSVGLRKGSTASCSTPTRASQKKKTALELIPARFIKTTTVKENTLDPVWNEKFRLDLEDVDSDRLHIDIWDHDDESSVAESAKTLNEVKGLKGLGRYFKQIAQSARTSTHESQDDFLGTVDIALVDIPSTGLDKWYDLHGKSARSNVDGQVRLRMSLATREDRGRNEEDGLFESREHRDLMAVFIKYEFNKAKESCEIWTGEWSKAAKTILHQHAIQGDISEVQQQVCLWMAFVDQFCMNPFAWSLLIKCFDDLEKKWDTNVLYREEEEALAKSFEKIIDYCTNVIFRQRDLLTLYTEESQARLTSMLNCLSKIHSAKVFQRCCPFRKDLKFEILSILKKAAAERYNRLQSRRRSETFTEDGLIKGFTLMMHKLNHDCYRALHVYTPIYESAVDVNYFQCLYKQTHRLLSADLIQDLTGITDVSADVELDTLDLAVEANCAVPIVKLYLSLLYFSKLKKHLLSSDNIGVIDFGSLFTSFIDRWISLVKCITDMRVAAVIKLDTVEVVNGHDIKQSTSAIDVAYTFRQIVDFWLRFRWSDVADPLRFVTAITEVVSNGAILYTDLMHNKLKAAGYYDDVGQFDVTEQLCITINDMEQVRQSLMPLPDALKFDKLVIPESQTGEDKSPRQCVAKADAVVAAKIKRVADHVADKMRPDMKKFVFHLCWAPEKAQTEDVIDELMNYLDSNLLTLNINLLRINFERILDSIWLELMKEISEILSNTDPEFQRATWISGRLAYSLTLLVDFFNADGKGLSMSGIQCPLYTNVHRQIEYNQLSTTDLIEVFFNDKLHQQENTAKSKFGTLYVRVYFNTEAGLLMIDVVNAKNLQPLDTNGLSDPYVTVQLNPDHVFKTEPPQQTKVISRNLNPQFNDTFEFVVTEDQCRRNGACVTFTVMDHDVLTANDFAGEAYLSLKSVPGINKRKQIGQSALTPQALPLLHPKDGDGGAESAVLRALSLREDQRHAIEFVKKRKDINMEAD